MNFVREVVAFIVAATMVLSWLAGAVLALGPWSTVAAAIFPPYAWYLVVERVMRMAGLV